MPVVERFIRYARMYTQSDRETGLNPSTPGQLEFAYLLQEEMQRIGMQEVVVDDYGYVMGFLPSNHPPARITVGFIAHMDTSPEMNGKHVKPRIIEQYKGTDIPLSKEPSYTLSPDDFPELLKYKGHDLIVTDGSTLLGADDKAGIAEILTAMEYLVAHPEVPHGRIAVCFTPDEEIGEGPDYFDLQRFGASFAYTLDGGELGELECENFNAAKARLTFKGRNFHPGYAKNKMVNSIRVADEFINSLPKREIPELTSGYEGFFHLVSIKGSVEETVLDIFIRDFDKETFAWRKQVIESGVREFSKKYNLPIHLEMKDQYYNMKEKVESVSYVLDIARQAMTDLEIKPLLVPIRGGTDGSRLSFMGLPCPNISNGAHNSHGRYEYISTTSMQKAVDLIVRISELCAALK